MQQMASCSRSQLSSSQVVLHVSLLGQPSIFSEPSMEISLGCCFKIGYAQTLSASQLTTDSILTKHGISNTKCMPLPNSESVVKQSIKYVTVTSPH